MGTSNPSPTSRVRRHLRRHVRHVRSRGRAFWSWVADDGTWAPPAGSGWEPADPARRGRPSTPALRRG
ncbi:MAG TPA: hypothetical protein VKG43_02635 [Acidimicrobiales bacterium]|nr:hypothetical protein [Acidimicrobiales bacterium]